jgi:hypothetical protein
VPRPRRSARRRRAGPIWPQQKLEEAAAEVGLKGRVKTVSKKNQPPFCFVSLKSGKVFFNKSIVLRLEHFSIFLADLLLICGAIWACLTPMAQVTPPPPIQFLAFLAECPQTASKTGNCFNLFDDFLFFYFYLAFISSNKN